MNFTTTKQSKQLGSQIAGQIGVTNGGESREGETHIVNIWGREILAQLVSEEEDDVGGSGVEGEGGGEVGDALMGVCGGR